MSHAVIAKRAIANYLKGREIQWLECTPLLALLMGKSKFVSGDMPAGLAPGVFDTKIGQNGHILTNVGGSSISFKVATNKRTIQGWSGNERYDATMTDLYSDASISWRGYADMISRSDWDETEPKGEQEIISWAQYKADMQDNSIKDALGAEVYADGSSTTYSGKGMHGLAAMTVAAGTAYAGITTAAATYWLAGRIDTDASSDGWVDFETNCLSQISKMVINCAHGNNGNSSAMFFTKADWYKIQEAYVAKHTIFEDSRVSDLGFPNLKYFGVPLLWDAYCPSDYGYCVDLSKIWFVSALNGLIAFTEGRDDNAFMDVFGFNMKCNLMCKELRTQGVFLSTAQTAS